MAGPAAAAALASESGKIAEGAGDVAKGAGDAAGAASEAVKESTGINIAYVLLALGILYFIFKASNSAADTADDVTEGVGGAGEAVGETAGDAYEGTQDVIEDYTDFVYGGTADTIKDVGDEVGERFEEVEEARSGLIDTLDPNQKGWF